jgi:hypothetical protein
MIINLFIINIKKYNSWNGIYLDCRCRFYSTYALTLLANQKSTMVMEDVQEWLFALPMYFFPDLALFFRSVGFPKKGGSQSIFFNVAKQFVSVMNLNITC